MKQSQKIYDPQRIFEQGRIGQRKNTNSSQGAGREIKWQKRWQAKENKCFIHCKINHLRTISQKHKIIVAKPKAVWDYIFAESEINKHFKNMKNQTIEIEAKVKAFSCESSPRVHRLSISSDGNVRVWDDVADHYTTVHAMSTATQARIRKLAIA